MFKILIIEDDIHKLESLCGFTRRHLLNAVIVTATSLNDAIESIDNDVFNLILIDMAIPSHPILPGEGSPIPFLSGGLEVILELSSLGREDDCIIVTQYPEIEVCGNTYKVDNAKENINSLLECNVVECIEYSEGDSSWKKKLKETISVYENFNP